MWEKCPKCNSIENTKYGSVDWQLYYNEKTNYYKCTKCKIAYDKHKNIINKIPKKIKSKSCRSCNNFQLGYGLGYSSKNKSSGPKIYEECIFKEHIIKDCKENNFNRWEKIED